MAITQHCPCYFQGASRCCRCNIHPGELEKCLSYEIQVERKLHEDCNGEFCSLDFNAEDVWEIVHHPDCNSY